MDMKKALHPPVEKTAIAFAEVRAMFILTIPTDVS